jgi:hypothetical protein
LSGASVAAAPLIGERAQRAGAAQWDGGDALAGVKRAIRSRASLANRIELLKR